MKVWLTRKHAERIDGIDLRRYKVGDTLSLPRHDACLLMLEEWAKPERRKMVVREGPRRRSRDQ